MGGSCRPESRRSQDAEPVQRRRPGLYRRARSAGRRVNASQGWLRIKDPFPGLSHWVGVVLSLAGLVVLMVQTAARPWWQVAGFAVYGGSLVLLYLASAVAHSLHCSAAMAERLDRLDYTAIFLLIAGTYTPLCLVTLR